MTTRYDSASSKPFQLPIVVLRNSHWENSDAPMLHISGGPGGAAYIDAESMSYWVQNFQAQNWGVDFVLYDQRGTGLSKPFLDCSDTHKDRLVSLTMPLNSSEDAAHFSKQMHQCYERLARMPSFKDRFETISTNHSVQDIADLHELLAVKQWVLMGVSYGTRLALEFVRSFPEKVESMVLDSVYPPEFDGFETMVENGFKGIDKLLKSCEEDTTCETRFPDLSEQLRQALFLIVKTPSKLIVPRENSALASESMLLTAHRLILLLDYASYDSILLREIPAAISAVLDQDSNDQSLLKLASNYLEIELFIQFSEPVFMITECKENGRFNMQDLYKRLQIYIDKYPMLDWSEQGVFNPEICKDWLKDINQASKPYRKVVFTDKPTLILSGELDSITPPEWGRELATQLPNSRYLEYPNVGHSVLTSSLCSNDEVKIFLHPTKRDSSFCDATERSRELSDAKMNWSAMTN